MWNDTEEPIAFLITFRTYGTWLPGDERGSIDKYHNVYGGSRAVASKERERLNRLRLKSPPFLLTATGRTVADRSIRDVCLWREWPLHALNVRTNHIHAVLSGNGSSGRMLSDLKSYATRALRQVGEWKFSHSPWVDKGSKRLLWNECHVASAVDYVVNGQGGTLPQFD